MIKCNVIPRRLPADDPFDIEKMAFAQVEARLVEIFKNKLSPLESELNEYEVNVNIDLNDNRITVNSPSMPDALRDRVQQALSEAPTD